jgi:hypothetical protein
LVFQTDAQRANTVGLQSPLVAVDARLMTDDMTSSAISSGASDAKGQNGNRSEMSSCCATSFIGRAEQQGIECGQGAD